MWALIGRLIGNRIKRHKVMQQNLFFFFFSCVIISTFHTFNTNINVAVKATLSLWTPQDPMIQQLWHISHVTSSLYWYHIFENRTVSFGWSPFFLDNHLMILQVCCDSSDGSWPPSWEPRNFKKRFCTVTSRSQYFYHYRFLATLQHQNTLLSFWI